MKNESMIRKILEGELVPALGCTEPMAFGLCAAAARECARGAVERIGIEASAAMVKGVQYVKIPRSEGRCGGKMACALGALAGRLADGMEVFRRVEPEDVAAAERMIAEGRVALTLAEDVPQLWLRVTVTGREGIGAAILQDRHDNVVWMAADGNVLRDTCGGAEAEEALDYSVLSIESILDYCRNAPIGELARAEESVRLNLALSADGFTREYGMHVGRTLRERAGGDLLGDDLLMYAVSAACAGVDARMGGSGLAAMSNSGSGNQGLTCTVPIAAAGERMGRSREEIVRAAAFGNLVTVFLKTHYDPVYGRMSPICCAALAAGGAASGVAYLRGADAACVRRLMQTVLGNVCGLVCDGAKANCASKVGMALHGAMQALLLAEDGAGADENCGIVDGTLERTACNFFRLAREGTCDMEGALCRIEAEKTGGLQ